ncbi:hypothetical protein CEE36_07315 [candidate division TA06 bacterium B3_TA06]|uniref:Uncharacterized protein n=1 Tax=candidate division TA06 bacterium B3_TA06 TaxID=2012487 RepID=A0A532V486_UNCT6|nr:MAG: hypothetical protein CEE36_07315 [candidate division TA06 bacterium B3_TA06]
MQLAYKRLLSMNLLEARRMIIEVYERYASISATAHQMGTSRQVVRKWIRRYEAEGKKGLMDRSRRPHISPRKTPYHPKRLLCNRLGTPIFCPKDKRRVKDEEFYLPCILSWNNADDMLRSAQTWQYVYNIKRPHFGKGMGGLSPLVPLRGINQTPISWLQSP